MTRRAWAVGLLVLLTAAGFALLALHWQEPQTAQFMKVDIKPISAAQPVSWPNGTVDVNTADAETLGTLDGINAAQIDALLKDRVENGAFDYPGDLIYVKWIGEKTLAKIFAQLDYTWRVPGNEETGGT